MSSETAAVRRKLPIVRLAIAAVVCGVVGLWVLREIGMVQLVAWVDMFVAAIRDMGPWMFFSAMAILPLIGAPLMVFNLVAGEAFAPQMTMPGVIATIGLVLAINLALTYWLARYALRPLLTRIVERYGYSIPRVTKENALTIALIVRLTPGPPYFVQGYLLGLAELPFRMFVLVSWLCVMPIATAAVMFGKAAREGHLGKIGAAIGLIVVAVVVVQITRKKVAKRES